MQQCFRLLTAAIFFSMVPVSGLAQADSGIPPMLENQRPMAVPLAKPEPPPVKQPKAVSAPKAPKGQKAKSATSNKVRKPKGRLATKKAKKPAAPKKGVTATPRGKSKENSS
jgi:hypothetical protein